MYCEFFGFSEKPFDVTPDPKFLYLTPGHREALSALIYGVRERRGFIVMVGEVGTGKTTLLNTLLGRLDEKTRVAFIFNTKATFNQMLNTALVDLGIVKPSNPLSKLEAVRRLNEFAVGQLARGGNVVLLVDEAQNLDQSSMEDVRLLSNLETRKHKLIQIVLSGQPELDEKLSQPELRQLAQRISIKRYITPLREEETYQYVEHRLKVAAYNGPPLFNRRSRELIWQFSSGVPRKINILCDNGLLIGYALRKKAIQTGQIKEAIKDLSESPFSDSRKVQAADPVLRVAQQQKTPRSRFTATASLLVVGLFLFGVGLLLGRHWLSLKKTGSIPMTTTTEAEATNESDLAKAMPVGLEPHQPLIYDRPTIPSEMTVSGILEEEVAPELEIPLQQVESDNIQAWPKDRGASVETPPPSEEEGAHEAQEVRVVVVKTGDNLYKIITGAYGRFDSATLRTVLLENPEIESPDQILVGQTIRLPEQ